MTGSERRTEQRWAQQFQVRLVMWNQWGEATYEDTVTVNISRRGAAIRSTLPLDEGRILQVIQPSHIKSLVAKVRARTNSGEGLQPTLLHLQFINQEWPLENRS